MHVQNRPSFASVDLSVEQANHIRRPRIMQRRISLSHALKRGDWLIKLDNECASISQALGNSPGVGPQGWTVRLRLGLDRMGTLENSDGV